MAELKDGGQAFPLSESPYTDDHGMARYAQGRLGMSLRDYFAAKAMAALIAKAPLFDRLGEYGVEAATVEAIHGIRQDIAQSAYDYADAMLEQRSKAADRG